MSLLSLDNLGLILHDLNKELSYKASENNPGMENQYLLRMCSDGDHHIIYFNDSFLWSSELESMMEPNMTIEKQMTLNEREHFEKHLRLLINDKLEVFNDIKM